LLTVAPTLTILLRRPDQFFALVQFTTAAVTLCGWLILVGGVFGRETLATVGYSLVWYGMGSNQPPKALDLFAVGGASPALLSLSSIVAVVTCAALTRADRMTI
jgi:hypothetical protein